MHGIFIETAVRVVKAAAVAVFNIPIGGTTVKVSSCRAAANTFQMTIKTPFKEDPLDSVISALQDKIHELVQTNVPLRRFKLSKVEAERLYGRAMYDSTPVDVDTLDLVYIDGLLLNVTTSPVLPHAGFLGTVSVNKTKFQAKRGQLELHCSVVHPECLPDAVEILTCVPPDPVVIRAINEPLSKPTKVVHVSVEAAEKPKKLRVPAADDSARVIDERIEEHQIVNPWDVSAAPGGIDYDSLVVQFGCVRIKEDTVARIERLTGRRAHRFLRRGLFYTHRDLDGLLDAYERGDKFYLYTGRGPSSHALHLGHLVPFMFTQYLQEAFNVPVVIQLTDDEKFLWKDMTLETCYQLGQANAHDIVACGFDVRKTFIFSDLDYIQHMYPTILKIQKLVTHSQSRGIFGFTGTDNIGKQAFPAVQAAPSFSEAFRVPLKGARDMHCLIPQAIDQDPYFRMARDVAPRAGWKKPALIHSKFFPALQGNSTKMSSSSLASAIYMSDRPKDISKKIFRSALSGGQETEELHRKLGADLKVDVAYQYLTFFMEDDAELERIGQEYKAGLLLTGQVKQILIDILTPMVLDFQAKRAAITEEYLREFMSIRPLEF